MGSSSSSPMADAETHGQAFSKTEYTRSVMDQLLNYMIKQLSVRDLLHMSNPAECKKYVLFKANSIYQYFYELRIIPTKDARGLLTFRKVEDLVNPKGEQDKERQSLCLIVAYFYTRIFQIYGALALTLIDDMNAMTSSGIMSLPPGSDARLRTPGYYPQQPYYGKGGVGESAAPIRTVTSNDSKKSLKNFVWIHSFLHSNDYTSGIGFRTRYAASSSERGDVYIKIEDALKDVNDRIILPDETPPPETWQDATFYIGISGMDKYATLNVETRSAPGIIKVTIAKLKFTNNFKESISTDQFNEKIYPEIQDGKSTYYVKDTTINIYLTNYFSRIIKYLKDAIKVHKNATDSDSTTFTGRRSEERITSHLQVEKMIDDLTTRKPLGHCIARALQLLKSEPFKNEPGISQICSAIFADNKRMGVVKPGKPLSDSPGLFALANLFYDTITMGSSNLTIGKNPVDGKSSMEQYIAFMTTLSKQYGSDILTQDEYEEKGLGRISNKRDTNACPATADIPLSRDATTKVHAIVKTMFQEQVKHAAKCFKIIEMLFNITYDKATKKPIFIKLHDNLISKGFPELERINREARELLVGYYTSCEDKYWNGMKIVLDEQRAKKATTNAANAKIEAETNAKTAEARVAEARVVEARVAPPKNVVVTKAATAISPELDARAKANEQAKQERAKKAQQDIAAKKGILPPTLTQQQTGPAPPSTLPLLRRHDSDLAPPVPPLRRT